MLPYQLLLDSAIADSTGNHVAHRTVTVPAVDRYFDSTGISF